MIADNTQHTTDDRQQTTAINSTLVVDSPWSVVKILAHLFSYLFHPIFIFLKTQKDRIIPYMACGIFFFWAYLVFKNQTNYPLILSSFLLGVFLASSAALLANIYFKISMHATGVGGLLGIFLLIMKSNTMLMTWPLCIAIAITGLVCTARLLISDHSTKEIYIGLIAGLLSQFVAAIVVL